MLTKTDVIYEWSHAQTRKLYHCVCHELRNRLLGKLFFLLPCITTNEETLIVSNLFNVRWKTAITYNSFGALRSNKDFQASFAEANKMVPGFYPLTPSITKNKTCKEVNGIFFIKIWNYLPNVFECFILKNLFCTIMFGFCSIFLIFVNSVSMLWVHVHAK